MRIRQLARLSVILAWVLCTAWPAAAQSPTTVEPTSGAPTPQAPATQAPAETAAAGIVEETGIFEEDLGEDIETLLAEAEDVFRSADQPESIPLFERIILLLERQQGEGRLDDRGGDWLTLSLFRRAEARHNLLDDEGVEADLTALLRFDPAWRMPEGYSISRKLADLLSAVRDVETGVLDPLIEPADAELYLDGELLGPLSGPRRVLAGERLLRVRRLGYTEIEQPLTIPPGESVPIELRLERTSAVVRLTTTPAGVEVVYGDAVVARSLPGAAGAEEEGSASLAVEGLAVGKQTLTLRKPGFRPVALRVEIDGLEDYSLDPVVLERARGAVVLSQVPAAARVLVDGEMRASPEERLADLRLELSPGVHEMRVEAGPAGLFEHRFELADRQLLEVDVRLRPSLVLLGVLGGDRVAAAKLEQRLVERLATLSEWAVAAQAERGFELLREAGIGRERMRRLAAAAGAPESPDWPALQGALDGGLAGSAYLLAVLSDDLYASRADLWLWSAAPGPARPARRRISLADSGGLDELAAALDQPLRLSSPWVGARFVDSPAAAAPLVLSVDPDGPAAAAGLRAGDTVSAVDGEAVDSAGELTARIAGLEVGREVALQVASGGEARRVGLTPGASPVVASLVDRSALDPALAARLASMEVSAKAQAPVWLVRLNRGVVLMRSGDWRGAAEALRGIEAPATAGVGQATVDYLLGVALLEVDRAAYRDTARGLIGRAAEGGARLEHNDGPLLAPRARARLETLLNGD